MEQMTLYTSRIRHTFATTKWHVSPVAGSGSDTYRLRTSSGD